MHYCMSGKIKILGPKISFLELIKELKSIHFKDSIVKSVPVNHC
jgi:hypothetical protein